MLQLRCRAARATLCRPGRCAFRLQAVSWEAILLRSRAASSSTRARTLPPPPARRLSPFDSTGVAKKFRRGVRVCLREEREQLAWNVEDCGEGFGRLPAERGRARRGVDEHEREVERECEVESAARERDVREAVEDVGDERADGELDGEERSE